MTFKDSNWLMSIVLAHQPHFAKQPAGVQVFWGYALFPDRVGNFVAKSMAECNGAEILREICGHLRFDLEIFDSAICIPCRMPYITSMFMPRLRNDRPLPVPHGSRNFAFISQFVEIADDVVFTVEYSVRAAQMAVYELLGLMIWHQLNIEYAYHQQSEYQAYHLHCFHHTPHFIRSLPSAK